MDKYNKSDLDYLEYLGILTPSNQITVRDSHVGASNYSKQVIQPWSIWMDYPNLTSFDHDIIKRILRSKSTDSRRLDYEKIIHICKERIRQIDILEKHSQPNLLNGEEHD